MSWDTVATCIRRTRKNAMSCDEPNGSQTGREVDVPRPGPLRIVVLVGNPPEGVFEAQQTDDSDLGCSRAWLVWAAAIRGRGAYGGSSVALFFSCSSLTGALLVSVG